MLHQIGRLFLLRIFVDVENPALGNGLLNRTRRNWVLRLGSVGRDRAIEGGVNREWGAGGGGSIVAVEGSGETTTRREETGVL